MTDWRIPTPARLAQWLQEFAQVPTGLRYELVGAGILVGLLTALVAFGVGLYLAYT